jgi:hypothetical protein
VRATEAQLWLQLRSGLNACETQDFPLPGVADPVRREVFLRQLVDSIRRVRYVSVVASRPIDARRADGMSAMFDPIRAALLKARSGDFDEACWHAFLFVHFGRHPISHYRYTREVYSALGQRAPWTFQTVAGDPAGLRAWLNQNEEWLRRGTRKGFGNHRKYQSLSGTKPSGTGDAFHTYVDWVQSFGNHTGLLTAAAQYGHTGPEAAFEWLYQSMSQVSSFGRIAKFDYLTMLQKLGLAHIRPGRPYLDSQTKGPNTGARAIFQSNAPLNITTLELRTQTLGWRLGVGMQEMEDALCNWGKNTQQYRYFGG